MRQPEAYFRERRRKRSPVPHAFRRIVLDQVGSTNAEAFALAKAGETGPLWIMAHRQTQGRGRSGRRWASEPGNLHASLLLSLACPPAAVHQLSLLAGVAVVDAIGAAAGEPVRALRLKWPNDVLIGEAKCAGILPESQAGGSAARAMAVIGVGINLAWHPEDLGRAATHLAAHGVGVEPEAMLAHLAGAMERWLGIWDWSIGFAAIREAWRARGGPTGEALSVDTGREKIGGQFLDLAEDGALIMLDSSGRERRLTYGEVTIRRPGT
jgi:BirA family transcriptional regulator, biotin operon repressor / biotin---[acetyl-CoA-carboxylase] ligase